MVEQDAPNWSSLTASEQDIVREEMRPFNSRQLTSLLWSLHCRNRFIYNPKIYKTIIGLLWKEALDFPINPSRKASIKRILGYLGLDQMLFGMKLSYNYRKHCG
jgi:hypothetical protein